LTTTQDAQKGAVALPRGQVTIEAYDNGRAKYLTPKVVAFLKPRILKNAKNIEDAVQFVESHEETTVEILLGDTAPHQGDMPSVYWIAIDKPIKLRRNIGTFIDDGPDDRHMNELVGSFSIKPAGDAPR
jgi:hypothetical protein